MKARYAMVLSSLLLGACASTGTDVAGRNSDTSQMTAEERIYDTDLMQRYENVSRRAGVRVYWVNKPRRRDSAETATR